MQVGDRVMVLGTRLFGIISYIDPEAEIVEIILATGRTTRTIRGVAHLPYPRVANDSSKEG